MKILIVDDERDVEILFRQKFRKEIKRNDLELRFAFSGQEALEMLQSEEPPKVVYVLSDINMPGMTGLVLLKHIKEKFPTIDVSIISAYGVAKNYSKAMEFGAKEYFTKPIDFESLRKEISTLIDSKNSWD